MLTSTLMTVEQWAELPDEDVKTELVQGEPIEVARGTYEHNWTRDQIRFHIQDYLRSKPLGETVAEQAVRVTSDYGRIPDVSFISNDRLNLQDRKRNVLALLPNLCVEVVSPSESAAYLRAKVHGYLDNGADTVWVVYMETHEAEIWEREGGMRLATDSLRASCLPGLEIPLHSVIYSVAKAAKK